MSVTYHPAYSMVYCNRCECYVAGVKDEYATIDGLESSWFVKAYPIFVRNEGQAQEWVNLDDLAHSGVQVQKFYFCPACEDYFDETNFDLVHHELWQCTNCDEYYDTRDSALGCCGSTETENDDQLLEIAPESQIPELPPELKIAADAQDQARLTEAMKTLRDKITALEPQLNALARSMNGTTTPVRSFTMSGVTISTGTTVTATMGSFTMDLVVGEDGQLYPAERDH